MIPATPPFELVIGPITKEILPPVKINCGPIWKNQIKTSGYATWFTAGGAIRIAHYDVIDDVITRKL